MHVMKRLINMAALCQKSGQIISVSFCSCINSWLHCVHIWLNEFHANITLFLNKAALNFAEALRCKPTLYLWNTTFHFPRHSLLFLNSNWSEINVRKNVTSLEVGIWAQYGDFLKQVCINKDQIKIKIKMKWYSHIVQDTPATMWIPRTQTLSTGPILLTWLNGNLGNLKAKEQVNVTKCTKMSCSMRCKNLTYVSNTDRWFIKHLLYHICQTKQTSGNV